MTNFTLSYNLSATEIAEELPLIEIQVEFQRILSFIIPI